MTKVNFRRALQTMIISAGIVSISAYAIDDTAIRVKWGYTGDTAPAHWGQLDPDFAACAKGSTQSPINITGKMTEAPTALTVNYQSAPMVIIEDGVTELMINNTQTMINDGHGVQLNFPPSTNETINFAGNQYQLTQFHMHTPSENKLNGQAFPLEIHFVHQGGDGKVAVIGVFVKEGAANPTLQKIIDNLPTERGKEVVVQNEYVNPADLIPAQHTYYNFPGSLTTPPCSEGLQWIVMDNTITASAAQIAKIKEAANGANARPVQSLNGRTISYSK